MYNILTFYVDRVVCYIRVRRNYLFCHNCWAYLTFYSRHGFTRVQFNVWEKNVEMPFV